NTLREMHLLGQLKHQHVVQGVGMLLEQRECSLLMTPVAECTLHDYLRARTAVGVQAVTLKRWLGCLASGLDSIHRQHIFHFDIKPANILMYLDRNRVPRLLISDFGASVSSPNSKPAISRPRGHTPLYAAPESTTHGFQGAAFDIFSLGCVYF
ncbi:kinase-like protein, partial [Microthyrium microscopicum]